MAVVCWGFKAFRAMCSIGQAVKPVVELSEQSLFSSHEASLTIAHQSFIAPSTCRTILDLAAAPNMMQEPPQPPLLFTATPASIEADIRRLIEGSRSTHEQVKKVHPKDATFANVLLPLAHAENAVALEAKAILFYKDVSVDSQVCEAASGAGTMLNAFYVESAMHEDLFRLVDAVVTRNESLDRESHHFLAKKHKEFIQNGLKLSSGPKRDRFKEVRTRLSQLADDFHQNLAKANDESGVWFNRQELDGVPQDVLSELEVGSGEQIGKLRATFKFPEFFLILKYANNEETRKRYFIANDNKCNQNAYILKEAVVLRDEAARMLEYPSHAAYRLEDMMARTPEVVDAFLDDLRLRLAAGGEKEVEELKRFKRSDVESRGGAFDDQYFIWDHPYYDRLMVEKNYSVDHQKIAEYFPLETTLTGVLDIFQRLFGLVFEDISPNSSNKSIENGFGHHNKLVWHEDVRLFRVWEAADRDNGFVGYLYLDMFPREGKHGHPSSSNLVPGFIHEDGARQYPATAMLSTFSKPTSKKPSLLKHEELVLLVHELGHCIHDLVSRTAYSRFHGFETVVDFGEAPSQMLENWCWIPSILKTLGRHYSTLSNEYLDFWKESQEGAGGGPQPPKQIPDEMIDSLIKAKYVNSALFNLRQVAFGMFDMMIHQPADHETIRETNVSATYNRLRRTILPLAGPETEDPADEWGHGEASFVHLMEDYQAGFYSYLYSKVYSTDIFYSVFKADPTNSEAGRRYRHAVLEKGGGQDEMTTLKEFLGRPPQMEAFYKELGLG